MADAPSTSHLLACPFDILLLIYEHLVDDAHGPYELSCHNRGRLPEQDDEFAQQAMHIPVMKLALHVQSFTWTLLWVDFKENRLTAFEERLTDIDYELWNVFSRLTNVRRLDLAPIHLLGEKHFDFIRQNPSRLFPAVTDLRLLGWMHRGLVDAIVGSLDPAGLQSLRLDYLQDEGAFPNGTPMSEDAARHNAPNRRGSPPYCLESMSDELYELQRTGKACIFPGPMWTPLRTLSGRCTSLRNFEIRIAPFSKSNSHCSYTICINELTRFISAVGQTLKSLIIAIGENSLPQTCTVSFGIDITFAADILRVLLQGLSHSDFPSLETFNLQGFGIFGTEYAYRLPARVVKKLRDLSEDCPIAPWEVVTSRTRDDWPLAFGDITTNRDQETMAEFLGLLEEVEFRCTYC
ncbi:hypothetical protein AJ80_00309 [Polytolypa hystricis UAMH7299]|uniref:Uncharacterized protein n=1 Tax=Polytolypa hystricis (strain UAMH7299) TaxID=1447883 RepID=A0A2B7Z489_POLH7|nr:hypothetical protein AJ80_00309 [Polytolypa hystricis UAMH7299]